MDPARLPTGFPEDLLVADGELRVAEARNDGSFKLLVVTEVADTTAALSGAVVLLTEAGWSHQGTSPIGPQNLTKGTEEVTVSTYPESGFAILEYAVGPGR
ncbi:hypothetical protein EFK50_18355 [Nocardioides marmoriginsengisoli]|uniref:Uncharacterized protein n=1 Tax=Nocardioides marmoriginsengisoli TaxID=661483 RepID=A0A3N0CCZ1_9ACTN|nr:hypothetical protein [Nocardioides marmoriginsengisoli]RNL61320.1 hypothetical protein EFK50_18355 [Nocardioides marmoriginsengisoli]